MKNSTFLDFGRGALQPYMENTPNFSKKESIKTLEEILFDEKQTFITSKIERHLERLIKESPSFKTISPRDLQERISDVGKDHLDTFVAIDFKDPLEYMLLYPCLRGDREDHIRETVMGMGELHFFTLLEFRAKFKSEEKALEVAKSLHRLNARLWSGGFYFFNEDNRPYGSLLLGNRFDDEFAINMSYRGPLRLYEEVKSILCSAFIAVNGVGSVSIIDDINEKGLVTRDVVVDESSTLGYPEFYPWMNGVSPSEYFAEFLMADEPLVICRGLPGTGKSTFINTAIHELGLNALMISKQSVIASPSFIGQLVKHFGKDNKYDIIIIEDGDALMSPRSKGNTELNELLSVLQGIGSVGVKLFITTNKETTEGIDTALIRHGRCYDNAVFGKLSPEEANAARSKIGLAPKEFRKPVTLAQALKGGDVVGMISSENSDHIVVGSRYPLKEWKK